MLGKGQEKFRYYILLLLDRGSCFCPKIVDPKHWFKTSFFL